MGGPVHHREFLASATWQAGHALVFSMVAHLSQRQQPGSRSSPVPLRL